jgi:hypothetical protein
MRAASNAPGARTTPHDRYLPQLIEIDPNHRL